MSLLISKAKKHDKAAFQQLIEQHEKAMYGRQFRSRNFAGNVMAVEAENEVVNDKEFILDK